jgi:hypothetical protein
VQTFKQSHHPLPANPNLEEASMPGLSARAVVGSDDNFDAVAFHDASVPPRLGRN